MNWKWVNFVPENGAFDLGGVNPWTHEWRLVERESAALPDPADEPKVREFLVYEIDTDNGPLRFAAQEVTAGVWGFGLER